MCGQPAKVRTVVWVLTGLAADLAHATCVGERPADMVDLREVAPAIVQDIRYAGPVNFVGVRIDGYDAAECILTRPAAEALARVQMSLGKRGFGLKVYDCYRPDQAVRQFVAWAEEPGEGRMRDTFFPRIPKAQLFDRRYISKRSGHSRGSTVDLAIVALPARPAAPLDPAALPRSCIAKSPADRLPDESLDFGTSYDCLDELSHTDSRNVPTEARKARAMLVAEMAKAGFENYRREWWHFTLRDEPYPDTCFDFPVRPR